MPENKKKVKEAVSVDDVALLHHTPFSYSLNFSLEMASSTNAFEPFQTASLETAPFSFHNLLNNQEMLTVNAPQEVTPSFSSFQQTPEFTTENIDLRETTTDFSHTFGTLENLEVLPTLHTSGSLADFGDIDINTLQDFQFNIDGGGLNHEKTTFDDLRLDTKPVDDLSLLKIEGDFQGAILEDQTMIASGALKRGYLEFVEQTTSTEYGTLSISKFGEWTYTADPNSSSTQSLTAGEQVTDTVTIELVDGSTHDISITLTGTNDAAIIGGVDTGTVTEDTTAILEATGTLTIADADTEESGFPPQTISGTFGTLTIDADGNWTYAADNSQGVIQDLGGGDFLTDTIQITSIDGTTHDITMTIQGSDSGLTITGTAGNDYLMGSDENDTFTTGTGADHVEAGAGNDTIFAQADGTWPGYAARNTNTGEKVTLKGKNSFHDTYDGGDGYDTLHLTDGSDALFLDNSFSPFEDGVKKARLADIEEIDAGAGDDIVDLTSYKYFLDDISVHGGDGNDTIWTSSGDDTIHGDSGNDSIYAAHGDDTVYGGDGVDVIYGAEGNDILQGGEGADSLYGQSGNDTLWFDAADKVIDGGDGIDTVMVDGNFDFTTLEGILNDIEIIDLNNSSIVTIDSAFSQSVNGEGYTIQIDGDSAQQVNFEDTYDDAGITNIDGKDYQTYTLNDTTIHVDTDITVVTPV